MILRAVRWYLVLVIQQYLIDHRVLTLGTKIDKKNREDRTYNELMNKEGFFYTLFRKKKDKLFDI